VPQRRKKSCGFRRCLSGIKFSQALLFAAKALYFVIPSEARNLCSIELKKERFLASLGMTKRRVFPKPVQPLLLERP
jgi:hypothetical protein